jgi:hypothetical protein
MEMMEMQVTQFTGPAAQGVDEDVGDAGNRREVDVIPAPDAFHRLVGRYECQGLHALNRAKIRRFFVYL